MSWTSATSSVSCCTARPTSVVRSWHRAKDRLNALNPHVEIDTYETALSSDNALKLFEPYDAILDGTDNFPTRYLINDACVHGGKPNVSGGVFRFKGQARSSQPREGHAIAACILSRRHPVSCQVVLRAVCLACCPGSSG